MTRRRQATKLRATPAWVDRAELRAIYQQAGAYHGGDVGLMDALGSMVLIQLINRIISHFDDIPYHSADIIVPDEELKDVLGKIILDSNRFSYSETLGLFRYKEAMHWHWSCIKVELAENTETIHGNEVVLLNLSDDQVAKWLKKARWPTFSVINTND